MQWISLLFKYGIVIPLYFLKLQRILIMAKMKEDGLKHINPDLINNDSEYCEWIHELKDRYRSSQIKAAVKVNSEMLLFNWQLGRDLVIRRAEEKRGKGIVEQVSRELQSEFPNAKGFSPRNLWFMKQWYFFYAKVKNASNLLLNYGQHIDMKSVKLNQVGSEIAEIWIALRCSFRSRE